MGKNQTPKELAAVLRQECESTIKTVRYSTALNAANAIDELVDSAAAVVSAFEELGRTNQPHDLLVTRRKCEAAMLKLKATLNA